MKFGSIAFFTDLYAQKKFQNTSLKKGFFKMTVAKIFENQRCFHDVFFAISVLFIHYISKDGRVPTGAYRRLLLLLPSQGHPYFNSIFILRRISLTCASKIALNRT